MSVAIPEDRSLRVRPGEIVRTGWVPVHDCRLANRAPMTVADVERKAHMLLNLGDDARFPPPNGHWESGVPFLGPFVIGDGRHEYAAHLIRGRERIFVAWIEDAGAEEARALARAADAVPAAVAVQH